MAHKEIITTHYTSPYGVLILGEINGQLCLADWMYRKQRAAIDYRIKSALAASYVAGESIFLNEVKKQLDLYFAKGLKRFDLPLIQVGTDFQKIVWSKLLQILYGETRTYLELSRSLSNEKAIRAVAAANAANALSIIVPCHRVIGANNKLTGYAGGLSAKNKLLHLENPAWSGQLELF